MKAKIVCFCGSSRYVDVAAAKMWEFEKRGIMAIGMHLLPSWYPGLKDRRGGIVSPMTLGQLRERIEAGEKFSKIDWGGCGCGGASGLKGAA